MRNTGADLIYDHDHVPFDHLHFTPIFSYSTIIKTGGREWRFLAYSLKKFNSSIWFWLPFTIAVLGMGVTFFVFWNFRKIEEAKQNEHLRVKQLESLNEVGHTIASELELSGLVKAVIESAVKLTEAEFGVFFYRNREEECSLFSHALAGPSEKDHWVKPFMESELFNTAISERKIITFDGPDLLPGWPDGSYLVVPFWSRQGMVDGAICLWHGQRGKFTQIELSIIQGLSAETSIGIDNAVLFKQAKEAVSLRDEFLSIASHELKTPLTSMKLQVQMSLRSSLAFRGPLEGLVEKQAEALKRTLLHINRLSGLVEELLDVTRIQHGKLIIRPSNFDLVLLIHETVGGFKEELARQYCTFILKAPAMVMVSLDYLRTQQVFTNLLSNVVKYAPGSHVLIDITQTEDSVEIIFSDDGPGIPKGKLDSIFNRFERANAPLNASGLGLGLYIVREIMLAHGGKVEVDGDIGQGTKFVLKFPLAEVNEKHDALATVS